jgi:hypothetical protein
MTLDQKPESAALRIIGRTRSQAEDYLVRHGMSIAGAALAVAENLGGQDVIGRGRSVVGPVQYVTQSIEANLP